MSLPRVSVVMVSYHTGEVLPHAIRAVLMQAGLSELILVDNGNPAETVNELAMLAAHNERFVLVTGQGNVGFSRGCNLGTARASGEYVLLLNPDCLLPADALTTFAQALEEN